MASITVDVGPDPRKAYYDFLGLEVKDYGEQVLEEKQVEIESREIQKMEMGIKPSGTLYILLGVAAIAVITLAILKKKGIL